METTWKLRPNVFWHDGAPFSAEDLLFTAAVLRDPRVPEFRTEANDWVEGVDAPNASTVIVRWDRPFIWADTFFSHELTPPLPRHLLESAYRDDPSSLAQLPYWAEQYVGTGPYRVREWVRGSHALPGANEGYVLGRPKIDVVEVRFIPDSNSRLANVFSGAVELTLGVGFSIEQAIQAREQWRDGRVAIEFLGNWVALYPQLLNPQLNAMGLFYTATPEMIGNRLANITTDRAPGSFLTWNAHEWDLRL
jgi:ABC-type transport system substrate-binding protein